MIKVFVAGPYSKGDVAQNVKRAMDVTNDLIEHGFAPYCPHLTHFLHINNFQEYEKWLELDSEYLRICDVVLRLPGASNGADKEVELAQQLEIPVFTEIKALLEAYV